MNEDIFHLGLKALIKNEEGKLLILKSNPEDFKFDTPVHWDLPGGRIEKGEKMEQALQREVEEEIGIKDLFNIELLATGVSGMRVPHEDVDAGLILAVYTCEAKGLDAIVLNDEHTEYAWVTPQEAAEKLAFKFPETITSKIKEL